MAATVRLFTHVGAVAMPISSYSGQLSTNGQFMLKEPYLAGETLTASTGAAVSSATPLSASDAVKMLKVHVQRGKLIHYELTPRNYATRVATTNSPIAQEETIFEFGPGWSISVLEAS